MASEYGWSFRDIMFNTYPEDFFLLQRQIYIRQIDDYLMQLDLAAYPHKNQEDARDFVDELMRRRRHYKGIEELPAELDIAAFEKFRGDLQNESLMIKAK